MKYLLTLVLLALSPGTTIADFNTGANLANEGNFEDANIEFRKGIEKGEAKSYFGLGSAYYFGDGVEVDLKRAFELFEEGAERNNGESAFMLSVMYNKGEYVERNNEAYLNYTNQSARACIPQAQHQLGYLLMDGELLERDYIEAAAWFMTAYWIDGDNDIPLGYLLDQISSKDRSKAIGRQKEIISAGGCETHRH